jgi:formate/nitrite transporter FocA (FNT family)
MPYEKNSLCHVKNRYSSYFLSPLFAVIVVVLAFFFSRANVLHLIFLFVSLIHIFARCGFEHVIYEFIISSILNSRISLSCSCYITLLVRVASAAASAAIRYEFISLTNIFFSLLFI